MMQKTSPTAISTYTIENVPDFLNVLESNHAANALQQLREKETFISTVYRGNSNIKNIRYCPSYFDTTYATRML